VDEAQEKQKEAEKKARTIEYQFNKAQEEVKTVKKKTDCEIKKLKNENVLDIIKQWRIFLVISV